MGRPKQIVNVKASPLGKDVVTPIVYDGFGRQVLDYLHNIREERSVVTRYLAIFSSM
ncbi:DUF6443 domain-containing protein [Chryseobacterium sp. Marseille-Q8038]